MSEATKGTPAAWKFIQLPSNDRRYYREGHTHAIESEDGEQVAVMDDYQGIEIDGPLIASAPTLLAENQRLKEVNAKLLAAYQKVIPAMEEACQQFSYGDVYDELWHAKDGLIAAIAEALAANGTPRNIDQICPVCGGIGLHFPSCGES